jgi:hypothetical protein
MTFIPAISVVETDIRCLWDGQRVESSLYWLAGSPPTAASVQALAESISAWFVARYLPVVAASLSLTSVYARDLTTEASWVYEDFTSAGIAGGSASPSLPNSNTISIKFGTSVAGRSGRGRNFWMGMTEDDIVGSAVQAGSLAGFVSIYADLLATAAPAGHTWVVLSRYHDNAPRVTGVTYPVTQVGYADAFIDVQRRRLPGRGT